MAIEYTKSNEKRLDKRYVDANDQYIGSVVVYGKSEDGKLYVDAEYTTAVSADLASDLFVKDILMVNVGDAFFAPVAFTGSAVMTVSMVESSLTATSWTVEVE